MSLREEMARYEHLTGESAEHIPIIKIGAFLDGVDRGIAELEELKAEIEEHNRKYLSDDNAGLERAIWDFIEPHISKLKGE